jgi:hypothetical protein
MTERMITIRAMFVYHFANHSCIPPEGMVTHSRQQPIGVIRRNDGNQFSFVCHIERV